LAEGIDCLCHFQLEPSARGVRKAAGQDKLVAELFEQIGKLKMELEWLKKP
jgi:hypothetical protein